MSDNYLLHVFYVRSSIQRKYAHNTRTFLKVIKLGLQLLCLFHKLVFLLSLFRHIHLISRKFKYSIGLFFIKFHNSAINFKPHDTLKGFTARMETWACILRLLCIKNSRFAVYIFINAIAVNKCQCNRRHVGSCLILHVKKYR